MWFEYGGSSVWFQYVVIVYGFSMVVIVYGFSMVVIVYGFSMVVTVYGFSIYISVWLYLYICGHLFIPGNMPRGRKPSANKNKQADSNTHFVLPDSESESDMDNHNDKNMANELAPIMENLNNIVLDIQATYTNITAM